MRNWGLLQHLCPELPELGSSADTPPQGVEGGAFSRSRWGRAGSVVRVRSAGELQLGAPPLVDFSDEGAHPEGLVAAAAATVLLVVRRGRRQLAALTHVWQALGACSWGNGKDSPRLAAIFCTVFAKGAGVSSHLSASVYDMFSTGEGKTTNVWQPLFATCSQRG